MGNITSEDILGYKEYAGDESEESMYEELLTWDGNTPMEVLQSKKYLQYEGQTLDVLFDVITITMGKQKEDRGELEEFSLNGYNWEIKSKDGGKHYRGVFKDGKIPMVKLCDIPVDNYIDFMVHYLVDATEYRLWNKGNDSHSYKVEARFFRVGLATTREIKGVYFQKYNITKEEVSRRIEVEYNNKMSFLYAEDVVKIGRDKIKKHINKGDNPQWI